MIFVLKLMMLPDYPTVYGEGVKNSMGEGCMQIRKKLGENGGHPVRICDTCPYSCIQCMRGT